MTKEETTMENEEVKDPAAVLAELRRVQEDLKNLRTQHAEATQELETLRASAADDIWRQRALAAEVKSTLTNQGLKDADRLIKVLGTDGIDFDEEGKITGLDDRLKEATKDYPELFDPKRRAAGKADAAVGETAEPKQDPLRQAVHKALTG